MIKDILTNSDIKALSNKPSLSVDELSIMMSSTMSESRIQIYCHNLIKTNYPDNALFLQIDNGGKMGTGQKKKKKAEGTQAGFPDVIIQLWKRVGTTFIYNGLCDTTFIKDSMVNELLFKRKSIYVEFKKIGGAIKPNQREWNRFLKEKGESVHFCNNTVYFEKVIMKEIGEFLN